MPRSDDFLIELLGDQSGSAWRLLSEIFPEPAAIATAMEAEASFQTSGSSSEGTAEYLARIGSLCVEEAGSRRVNTEHLLCALSRDNDSIASKALRSLGITYQVLMQPKTPESPFSAGTTRSDGEGSSADRARKVRVAKVRETPTAPDLFSNEVRKSLSQARDQAWQLGSDSIAPVHILLGILEVKGSAGAVVLGEVNFRADDFRKRIPRHASLNDREASHEIPFSEQSRRALVFAVEEAKQSGDDFIRTDHLVRGLLRDEQSDVVQLLLEQKINYDVLRVELQEPALPATREYAAGSGLSDQFWYSVTDRVKALLVELLGCSPDNVQATTILQGLFVHPADIADFRMALEEEYDITIHDSDISSDMSVTQIVDYLKVRISMIRQNPTDGTQPLLSDKPNAKPPKTSA